ncbi:MAG: STAS domain-containing protein [Phycisphaerae bacterium]|nr:STAS domain-containing protein [Phycisphaerae bacterium]
MSTKPMGVVKEIRRGADSTVVVLSGDVDLHQSPTLHAALVEVAADRPKKLILNLGQVQYMDSSGVGTLVELLRRVNAYKGKLALVGLTDRVRSVFEITKLDKFFSIHATEDEAHAA